MPAVPVLPVDPAEAALTVVRELGAAAAPAADFVSAALLGDIEEDEDFLAGYASATVPPSCSPRPCGSASRCTAAICT